MWGVSLTRLLLFYTGNFSYTPIAVLCGDFLLHSPCCFMWGVSLTHSMLFYVGTFSSTPDVVLCREFLLHAPCRLMWGISLTRPLLFYVRSFSYTHFAVLCGEFLLHAPCCFICGVSLSRPLLVYVGSLTPHWSKTLKKNQSHWKREKTAKSVGYSAALLAYAAAHDTGFVGTQMASMGLSARSGHSHRWPGKYGPIGAQGRLPHRVWLRLRIASLGSEQIWPFPCIWAQETCVVCAFQCPDTALPRTTLGLCTASWPNLTIQAVVGTPSYTRPR